MDDANADAGEVLDAIASGAQRHPTAESALASDAQHHPAAESALASDARHHLAAESALASDAHHHLATESALASDTQQHPAAVTTAAPAQEAVPPELHHQLMELRGDDAAGSFLAAAVKRAEDAIADEYDARARLLEARCEEAATAVRAAEQDISCLNDELAELRIISEEIIPELNCEDPEEQNQRLRALLDATTKELKWKMDKIAELQELEKDNGPTHGALEVNTLDMTGGENKLPVLHEMEKGALEINTSELGDGECKVADHALMLHENHKQEMEAIHAKIIQLERQLEQRDKALVLIARQLNMKLQAGEKVPEEDHQRLYAVMTYVRNIVDEEGKRMKVPLLDLFKREQANSKELQENRQELIQGFENMPISGGAVVRIKRMGQLDENPFRAACNLKYRDNDPEGKAARLVSYWQEEIQKPSWRPFTNIQVDEEDKEVIDDNDPRLSKLRLDYGDSVCNAVKDALRELNEYSPDERRIMNEVWNFREGRKATMTEVITCILEQLAVADPGLRGQEFKVPPKKCSNSI
ncbi:factor of DNA methylation 2-like [Triticum urartu]|uniref:factor of DNA methylation 2-like n=1 Tax=Triticum urartu TaxID=4572 RepID=UPI002044607A|nr:factor of DNA methylation 2-like [Triticum urartu]